MGLLVLGGCGLSRTARDLEATAIAAAHAKPLAPEAWPARWKSGLHACTFAGAVGIESSVPFPRDGSSRTDLLRVRRVVPMGEGLVTFAIPAPGAAPDFRDWDRWESPEALRGVRQFSYFAWDERERPVWELPKGRSENSDDVVSLQRAINRASIAARFRLLMPDRGQPKGLVLFVPPISAAELSLPLPLELIKRGWGVLSVDRIEVLQSTRSATVIEVPWAKRPPVPRIKPKPIEPPASAAGRWMGEWIKGDMADMSYAFQTALEFVEQSEPGLREVPLVVLGTSLGAIFTPPLVARLGERVDGAVLIGGGADMLRIMAETDPEVFNIGLLLGEGDVRLTPERGKKWDSAYLANNPLDPVHTAPALAMIPTLMVHAGRDGLVPAPFGDLLWEKAGRPERWTLDAGHIWLFVTMKDRAGEIADWIEANIPARGSGDVPPGGGRAGDPR